MKKKSQAIAVLLAFFLGGFGIQHFYLGRMKAGVLSLLFFWTLIPALWAWVDIIMIALMDSKIFHKKYSK